MSCVIGSVTSTTTSQSPQLAPFGSLQLTDIEKAVAYMKMRTWRLTDRSARIEMMHLLEREATSSRFIHRVLDAIALEPQHQDREHEMRKAAVYASFFSMLPSYFPYGLELQRVGTMDLCKAMLLPQCIMELLLPPSSTPRSHLSTFTEFSFFISSLDECVKRQQSLNRSYVSTFLSMHKSFRSEVTERDLSLPPLLFKPVARDGVVKIEDVLGTGCICRELPNGFKHTCQEAFKRYITPQLEIVSGCSLKSRERRYRVPKQPYSVHRYIEVFTSRKMLLYLRFNDESYIDSDNDTFNTSSMFSNTNSRASTSKDISNYKTFRSNDRAFDGLLWHCPTGFIVRDDREDTLCPEVVGYSETEASPVRRLKYSEMNIALSYGFWINIATVDV